MRRHDYETTFTAVRGHGDHGSLLDRVYARLLAISSHFVNGHHLLSNLTLRTKDLCSSVQYFNLLLINHLHRWDGTRPASAQVTLFAGNF